MSDTEADLASLLCSRLCHDLLSPVGAMNNGLELLAEETDPEMRRRCMELLAESAKAAADKLKFFRLAFGAAGGFGPMVDPGEARTLIETMVTADGRTTLNWVAGAELAPKAAIKVLLNIVQIVNDALVRGGTVDVGFETREGVTEIVVRGEGPRVILDAGIRRVLSGPVAMSEVESRTAAAYMIAELVANSGGVLQLAENEGKDIVIGAMIHH